MQSTHPGLKRTSPEATHVCDVLADCRSSAPADVTACAHRLTSASSRARSSPSPLRRRPQGAPPRAQRTDQHRRPCRPAACSARDGPQFLSRIRGVPLPCRSIRSYGGSSSDQCLRGAPAPVRRALCPQGCWQRLGARHGDCEVSSRAHTRTVPLCHRWTVRSPSRSSCPACSRRALWRPSRHPSPPNFRPCRRPPPRVWRGAPFAERGQL